jgi:hypothetical protein
MKYWPANLGCSVAHRCQPTPGVVQSKRIQARTSHFCALPSSVGAAENGLLDRSRGPGNRIPQGRSPIRGPGTELAEPGTGSGPACSARHRDHGRKTGPRDVRNIAMGLLPGWLRIASTGVNFAECRCGRDGAYSSRCCRAARGSGYCATDATIEPQSISRGLYAFLYPMWLGHSGHP